MSNSYSCSYLNFPVNFKHISFFINVSDVSLYFLCCLCWIRSQNKSWSFNLSERCLRTLVNQFCCITSKKGRQIIHYLSSFTNHMSVIMVVSLCYDEKKRKIEEWIYSSGIILINRKFQNNLFMNCWK